MLADFSPDVPFRNERQYSQSARANVNFDAEKLQTHRRGVIFLFPFLFFLGNSGLFFQVFTIKHKMKMKGGVSGAFFFFPPRSEINM